METKQIKEKINRMMQAQKLSPDQAVELMASVMSLVEVRALADDLTAAVVDKAISEIEEGKLTVEKSLELFEELRARAEKEEVKKAQSREPGGKEDWSQTMEDFGSAVRDFADQAFSQARVQIKNAREKFDKTQDKIRRKMEEKGSGKVEGDVVQDHYTANAAATITGDLKALTAVVRGVLTLGGDLTAKENLKVSGRLDCGGNIESGDINVHGGAYCGRDLKCGDLSVLGRLRCGGDMACGDVTVKGSANCKGDILGSDLSISGKMVCSGNARAKQVNVSGGLDCAGGLQADIIHSSGSIHCGGDMRSGEIAVSGKALSDGDIKGDKIKVSGKLSCEGDMTAGDVHLSGQIKCGGDMKGGTVHVKGRLLGGGDMHIGTLTVEEPNEWLEWLSGGLIKDVEQVVCDGDLQAETVHAAGRMVVGGKASFEKGSIECLKAGSVVLGPGVKAKHVEYKDELVLAEGAEVEDPVQVS
jgi:cytoskeletal protein CcmA (bactofilin family)/flagellar biosynthesis chaperone FliJ